MSGEIQYFMLKTCTEAVDERQLFIRQSCPAFADVRAMEERTMRADVDIA